MTLIGNRRRREDARRMLFPPLALLALAVSAVLSVPQGARAQDPDWHHLPLRDPSPVDGLTVSRLYLQPCCDVLATTWDACTNSWTSGGYERLGDPDTWTLDTRPTWDDPPVWVPIRVDLSDYANRAVAIVFIFRTNDDLYNNHEGVFVDSIRIGPLAHSATPEPTYFTNGADTTAEQGHMLVFNEWQPPGPMWHPTQQRSHQGDGSWWFGSETTRTYEAFQSGDPCVDAPSRGYLMTPVIKLGADPTLEFELLFKLQSGPHWRNTQFPVDAFQVSLLVDTDEDGLADRWEMEGVDTNANGQPDLFLPDANPMHKDLYVELDCMPGTLCPLPGVIDQVVDAFRAMRIDNLDGVPGIMLHVDATGTAPDQATLDFIDGSFDAVKQENFDQRRACCYHYGVWAHALEPDVAGRAEVGGNDFIIGLPLTRFPPPTRDEQASVLMHELGHNLNLDHGGTDDINHKPHYFSIMNYRYAYTPPAQLPGGRLRFSEEHLGLLEETNLDEYGGVPEGWRLAGQDMTYHCPEIFASPGSERTVDVDQPAISWDCDLPLERHVCTDITGDAIPSDCSKPLPLEESGAVVLQAASDALRINLLFGEGESFADAVHTRLTPPEEELTQPLRLRLLGDPSADTAQPQVALTPGLTGPNGRPAASVELTDPGSGSGLRLVRIYGPNVQTVRQLFPLEPPTLSASLLVEATDDRPPMFSLVADDWARNALGRSFGFPDDVLPPSCALAAAGTDATGATFVDVLVRDDGQLNSVLEVLLNAAFSGETGATSSSGVMRFTRLDETQPMQVELRVHDGAANMTSCGFDETSQPIDTDADGVADVVDNCPVHANAGQEDGDNDGVGDACLAVSVVSVEGATEADAVAALAAALLRVGTITRTQSATVPAGSVIAQWPAAGRTVAEGTAVDLAVSLGPAMRTVPNVVGLAEDAAVAALTAAGLSAGVRTSAYSDSVPTGAVISQSPTAGASVPEGSAVDLVISLGPRLVVVPDVAGLPQAEAEATLAAAGLAVGSVSTAHSATVPAGRVVSQSPAAGSSVPEGSPIDLVISLGPRMVTVPDVAGLTQAAATSAIQDAGLVVGAVGTAHHATVPVGAVISQSPAAGTTVAEGTAVDVVVSLGPVMVTVPNVTGLSQADAVAALTAAGLTIGTVSFADSFVTPDHVVSQHPPAGNQAPEGFAVDLVVSRGFVNFSIFKTAPASVQGGEEFTYVLSYVSFRQDCVTEACSTS